MKKNTKISLDEIGRELPFSVPENYFEHFALRMDEQIQHNPGSNHRFLKQWMYVAAAFVGIFMLGQTFYTVYQTNATQNADTYEAYVLSQVNETSMMDYYVDEPAK
jgi:hypothetical protein